MKRFPLLLLSILLLFACRDENPAAPPAPGASAGADAAELAIVDGEHNKGNPHFFFLPPMAPKPNASGEFNPELLPVVEICALEKLDSGEAVCDPEQPPIRFTTAGKRSEAVRLVEDGEHWIVNWHTGRYDLDPTKSYRIRVFPVLNGTELGHANVDLVASRGGGPGAGNPGANADNEFVTVRLGSTLPIKFRIERGIFCGESEDCAEEVVGREGATVVTSTGFAGVLIPEEALDGHIIVIIERQNPEEQPTGHCLPTTHTSLEQAEGCYRYDTDPALSKVQESGLNQFNEEVTVGICLEDVSNPDAYALHKYDPENADAGVVKLPNTDAPFVDCTEFTALGMLDDAGPLERLARAGWDAVVRAVGPRSLWATDAGLGGLGLSFSRIGWARALNIEAVAGDGQRQLAGTTLDIDPAVRVTAGHSAGHEHGEEEASPPPVAGVEVTFTITGGGGTPGGGGEGEEEQTATEITVITGEDGIARVPWTLGDEAGTNTLAVTAAANGSPVIFEAIATDPGPLYGINSADDGLSIIDPASGEVTFVGPLDQDTDVYVTPVALAVRPSDGALLAWNNSNRDASGDGVSTGVLLTVDPCTGDATPVGTEPQGGLDALAFAPDGDLYGLGGALYAIDVATAVRSLIGSLGLRVAGADFAPDGRLYGVELSREGEEVVVIDPQTAEVQTVSTLDTDVGVVGSIVFDETGTMIGSGFGGPSGTILFDIEPSTGHVSNIRSLSGGFAPQGMGFGAACSHE